MEIRNVGFIGLGLMGKPMARNLLKAGYRVTVKSRGRGPVDEMIREGAKEGATPRAVAEASELVITMLPNSPQVEAVCLGEGGIIEAFEDPDAPTRHGTTTVVDMSTISPRVSQQIARRFQRVGVDFLEAPVSGGDVGAIAGTLSIMAGGPERAFERALPVLKALGKSVILVGDWGAGQTTKLANNIICAATIESVGEAFVLGAKAGIDPEKMFQAIRGGAAQCWSMDRKAPKWMNRDFKPGFMVKLHLKDMKLALEAARELGVALPVSEKTTAMLQQLQDEGCGDEDNGALVKVLEKLAGVEVRQV